VLKRRGGAVGVAAGPAQYRISLCPFRRSESSALSRHGGERGDEISKKCLADTGIKIEYIRQTTDDVTKRVITQKTSFDVLDTEYL